MEHSLFSIFCSVCVFPLSTQMRLSEVKNITTITFIIFVNSSSLRFQVFVVIRCHFFPFQASLIMYELAWKMSKDSNDLLWWAAIGLTHQYLYEKIDRYVGRYYFKVHSH